MSKLIVYGKGILLILSMIFGLPNVGYSQVDELNVDYIYDKVVASLVWIVNPDDRVQGSGVLIDKELRILVTNYHVTKDNESVIVFFPLRDWSGKLIEDRDFYMNKNNFGVLKRLGYSTTGRIIAKDPEIDLAIVQIQELPETAREIEYNFSYSVHHSMSRGDMVQIFGNPGDLMLWRWTFGRFQKVEKEMLFINADIYKGNSGGPVVNDQGMLIGIATRSNERTVTWAIPSNKIGDLLNTLKPRHIFSIQNKTGFTVTYYTKWKETDNWKKTEVKSAGAWNHWYTGSLKNTPAGYPQIRFDYIANDGRVTYQAKPYRLETYTRRLGSGVKPDRKKDARKYHFRYNSRTQRLVLYDSEK